MQLMKKSGPSSHFVVSVANRVMFSNSLCVVRLKVISKVTAEKLFRIHCASKAITQQFR